MRNRVGGISFPDTVLGSLAGSCPQRSDPSFADVRISKNRQVESLGRWWQPQKTGIEIVKIVVVEKVYPLGTGRIVKTRQFEAVIDRLIYPVLSSLAPSVELS